MARFGLYSGIQLILERLVEQARHDWHCKYWAGAWGVGRGAWEDGRKERGTRRTSNALDTNEVMGGRAKRAGDQENLEPVNLVVGRKRAEERLRILSPVDK